MENSGECCVIISTYDELKKAPQVTHIQEASSPPPQNSERRNKEETPSFEDRSGLQDNSKFKQGRLLFLTSTSNTSTGNNADHCVDNGAEPAATTDMGTKKSTDVNASKNEVALSVPLPLTQTAAATLTPTQALPKVVKAKLTKEKREALRQERERQRAEKEKERAKAKAKREEEKEKRKLEKQRKEEEKRERQRKREQEMKDRQEKREREEQEKKEKREKREAEKQRKEDEKKRREEEKRQLEMEKEQAKGEKLRKEQQAQKRISSFFQVVSPKGTIQNKTVVDSDFFVLTPFPTKPDVALATPPRPPLQDSVHFDMALAKQDSSLGEAYLEECKHKTKISRERKEEECDKNDDECMEVDDDVIITSSDVTRPRNIQYKLLQFHTNHRPAYFGTWRKRSKQITPRNPFKKDMDLLDYEVDSDDEWEEEDPGESLSNSEGEDGGESGDDEEEEDGFFVPHGYLSDSEGDHSGDEDMQGQDNHDLKQQKQVSKAKAWEAEFARKCQPLRPIKIGCLWTSGGAEPQEGGVVTVSKDMEFLQQFEAVPLVELPVAVETKGETTAEGVSTSTTDSNKPRAVPEEAMPDLIRLVHKNSMGLARLMKTFREQWGAKVMASNNNSGGGGGVEPMGTRERSTSPSDDSAKTRSTEVSPFCKPKTPGGGSELENASGISKRQVEKKIQSMAVKEARPPSNKQLWYVHDSVLQKYGIDGNALSPLQVTASPSVVGRAGGEHGTSVNSPQTPCGSGAATRKRKVKGMKSLFDFVNSAAATSAASSASGGREAQPPSLKKSRIEAGGSNTAATKASSKPLATLTSLPSNNVQVLPTSTTTPNDMEPPLKKARLDLTVESPPKLINSDKEVIVIDSDNSNDKENSVGVGEKAAPISLNPAVDKTNAACATATLSVAPTLNLLAKLVQQCTSTTHH